jgi:subtilase family serine protease
MGRTVAAALLSLAAGTLGATTCAYAGPTGYPAQTIHDTIDATKLVTLAGNTRPEAIAQNDRGAVADTLPLGHMFLQLQRSPEREAALKQYIDELHDPKSANYHQWLTAADFAEHYGVDSHDVETVKNWLKSEGFTVHGATPTGLLVDFEGTAGQVRTAFNTEIHNYVVSGVNHIANASDPKIPAALAPAVAGVVSLHDFHPKPMNKPRIKRPAYTESSGSHAIVPGDIEMIYNINPLLGKGYSGQGQTIVLLEDTYLYSTTDWTIFRKTFGLARLYPKATLTQESPSGSITCTNPGVPSGGDDGEAAIDVEWASAAAPSAAIVLAACKDGATVATFGGLIALENILNSSSLPNVVSLSYGESEASDGAAGNLAFNNAFSQAVTEGVSIFSSSGDEDASSSANGSVTKYGIGVSGWTSTPYNVSVGGTDFGYIPEGVPATNFWNATNNNYYSSALSYIPEIPWNNSCAGGLLVTYLQTNSYYGLVGPISGATPWTVCNNSAVDVSSGAAYEYLFDAVGGSGGPSGCATGTPASGSGNRGVVSGTCAGYPKPAWQSVYGNPSDGVRDIPDVALMASNGFWDAYYVVCWSNPNVNQDGGGYTCQGTPDTWAGFGGTSVSTPIMAGIQALVNQYTGERWGNPNTVYYYLANEEYGASGSPACNSSTVTPTSNNCWFYDITQGDNIGACKKNTSATFNCDLNGYTYGVLSTSNTALAPNGAGAYATTTGWDFATGIGSVNANNLVQAFYTYSQLARGKK